MPLLFAVTLFVSASLLFMVQPMVGKMVLPLLGGSPAVWNACMVFFQALLLLGYLYAHWLSTRFEPKKQWGLHLLVLLVPVGVMAIAAAVGSRHTPIAVAESLAPTDEANPFLSVFGLLAVAIGVPFFVSSTSAPLLQKWFAYTGHPSARDPYFLYAASNAGSLISLLGYPLFIEPYLSVVGQTWVWAVGFVALVGLIFVCGRAAANPIGVPPASAKLPSGTTGKPGPAPRGGTAPEAPAALSTPVEPAPGGLRKLRWVALAFVPSSLMLGVTTHMTTDIVSLPLLWVFPLALYLVTFIIAFSRLPPWFRLVIGNLAPVLVLLLVFSILTGVPNIEGDPGRSMFYQVLMHLATFFAVALMCHYELALDRPDPAHLTEFFLWISVGGVLGGLFNALFAPVFLTHAYEYPIALVVACFLVPTFTAAGTDPGPHPGGYFGNFREAFREGRVKALDPTARRALLDFAIPVVVGLVFLWLTHISRKDWYLGLAKDIGTSIAVSPRIVHLILVFAAPVMVCFFFVDRPIRFGLCVAAVLGIGTYRNRDRDVIHTDRSFFGILKVENDGRFRRLVHGTTLHGTQAVRNHFADQFQGLPMFTPWDPLVVTGAQVLWKPQEQPLTYYHTTGPVGAMFHELRTRKGGADAKSHVAMVGLGTGSVSCYALPGQKLTFYEIDPAVRNLVEPPTYFTYVDDATKRGADLEFRMGDARLKLREATDQKYSLLLIDAFTSDAIPVHLLTREALELYLDRLTEDGFFALHISNKYVRLEPVVARLAHDLGLTARVWNDDSEGLPGKTASSWVVLARKPEHLGVLAAPSMTQALTFGSKNRALIELINRYGPETPAKDAIAKEYGDDALPLEDFAAKHGRHPAVLREYAQRYEVAEKRNVTLGELVPIVFGPMFRELEFMEDVPAWTDDYSDVLRVLMIPEIQAVRRAFGLPALPARGE